jgi:dihydrofolate reductase
MAVTPNGFIAGQKDDTSWVSKSDWKEFIRVAKKKGNVVMGRRTYEAMLEEKTFPVPDCLNIVMTSRKKLLANAKWDNVIFTNETPLGVLEHLKEKKMKEVLIAGGGKVSASFLKDNLIDELYLTVEPIVFGRGVKLFDGSDLEKKLKFVEMYQLSPDEIQLHYRVKKQA